MDKLKEQIAKTLRNLERGEVMMEDRVFLDHVLGEFQYLVDLVGTEAERSFGELAFEMIGSTCELVEDGLD